MLRVSVPNAIRRALLAVFAFLPALVQAAEGDARVYLSVPEFLAQVFAEDPPPPEVAWLDQDARARAEAVSGEDPGFRRRYWQRGGTTAWVIDVIGRDHPITVGVAVNDAGIQLLRVLIYRESRGWEVRHEFFTRQFDGAALKDDRLDRRIDGITGATLSVDALQRAARLALWLHRHTTGS